MSNDDLLIRGAMSTNDTPRHGARDAVYAEAREQIAAFRFDAAVAEVFADMIARSSRRAGSRSPAAAAMTSAARWAPPRWRSGRMLPRAAA